jgi:hypothetical protein
MAKKKSSADGFVLAEELRAVLKDPANKSLTAPEVIALVQQKFPDAKINVKSATVAVSTAKRKLGLSRKKSAKKRVAKPGAARGLAKSAAAPVKITWDALAAARDLVKSAGSVKGAKEVLDQLAALASGVN